MLRALLEIVVLLLVIRAVWKVLGNVVTVKAGVRRRDAINDPPAVKLVRDPVCGTYVSPDSAISDRDHYFCSDKCRNEFRQTRFARRRAP